MPTEHLIGHVEDFPPGGHKVVAIGRRQIGVFNLGGKLHALPNICPHQTGPLCDAKKLTGALVADAESGWRPEWRHEGEVVTCPWHGLQFVITSGQCLNYRNITLRRYPISVRDGDVFLTLGATRRDGA